MENSNNGLKLISLYSTVETEYKDFDSFDLDKLITDKFTDKTGTAVLYLDYGIEFAQWKGSELLYHDNKKHNFRKYGILARIFNKDKELKIWKNNTGFSWRTRIDSETAISEKSENTKMIDVIQADQILWGTKTPPEKSGNGWTCLTEDRGTELTIPLDISIPEGGNKQLVRAAIRTRNYITYINDAPASYEDDRFVELVKWGDHE